MTGDLLQHLTWAEIRADVAACDASAGPEHPASRLKAGTLAPNGIAVAGRDGHMFIGDGANRWERQYLGELGIAEDWYAAWSRVLQARAAEAARRGVSLLNVVIPEKQVVLADHRWTPVRSGEGRPLRKLLERLPDAPITYLEDALRAEQALAPTYFRHDSHWSPAGCCAGLAVVAARLGCPGDYDALRFAYRPQDIALDLTQHFFEPAPTERVGLMELSGEVTFDNDLYKQTGKHTGSSYGRRNPAAPDPRHVVVFGDSYSYGMGVTAVLTALFAQTTFMWSKAIDWALVDRLEAQVVIWESAERFLATVPQA